MTEGVRQKKINKQGNKHHASIWFSFWLWANKKKRNVRNSWMGLGISSLSLATVWDACRSSWTLQKHKRSKESDNDEHSSVTFMLTNGQCDSFVFAFVFCEMQSKRMPCKVNGDTTGWGKRASGQPNGRGSSLLTTVWCKRLEMMLLKRWIKQNWTGNKWNKEGEKRNESKKSFWEKKKDSKSKQKSTNRNFPFFCKWRLQ